MGKDLLNSWLKLKVCQLLLWKVKELGFSAFSMRISTYFPHFQYLILTFNPYQPRAYVSPSPETSSLAVCQGWGRRLVWGGEGVMAAWVLGVGDIINGSDLLFRLWVYPPILPTSFKPHFQRHLVLPVSTVKLSKLTAFLPTGLGSVFSGPLSSLYPSSTCFLASMLFAYLLACSLLLLLFCSVAVQTLLVCASEKFLSAISRAWKEKKSRCIYIQLAMFTGKSVYIFPKEF